jgi:predicted alpha/beta hydrolase
MHVHAPVVSAGRDFFPPKLGGLSNIAIPAGVTRQWARWARKPGYLYDPKSGVDVSGFQNIRQPLLAWQFDDDPYAPQSAHDAILAAYPNARIERRAIRSRELGRKVGHFGFFREPSREPFWRETAQWLHQT